MLAMVASTTASASAETLDVTPAVTAVVHAPASLGARVTLFSMNW
jgi:hypothetical protein